MNAPDPELKKELDATLQTRRELGPEYESELVDSFLEKVEERLDSTVEQRVRRQTAEQQMAMARSSRSSGNSVLEGFSGPGVAFGLAALSLVLAIPLSAIAATQADLAGLLVCWGGIVGVNLVHALGRRSLARERKARPEHPSDWD